MMEAIIPGFEGIGTLAQRLKVTAFLPKMDKRISCLLHRQNFCLILLSQIERENPVGWPSG